MFDFYRKKAIDSQGYQSNNHEDCPTMSSYGCQLTIIGTFFLSEKEYSLFDKILHVFNLTEIVCLDIVCDKISIEIFVQILNNLKNLEWIRVWNFPSEDKIMNLNEYHVMNWNNFLLNNKIKKLTIQKCSDIKEITRIITIFHRIKCLLLELESHDDIKLITRHLLLEIKANKNFHLMEIYLFCEGQEYDRLKKLKQIIDLEHLLKDYVISRQFNVFHIRWN